MNLEAFQAALREARHDGWLFYDHHHRDPIGGRILGLDEKAHIKSKAAKLGLQIIEAPAA
jgi:Xaa-Pro dipeptidase